MSRRGALLAAAAAFLLVRLVLLVVREPFFDELFTVWLARRPFGEIVNTLTFDSGPPLYYLLARIPNVYALRVLSLFCALGAFALIATRQSLGDARANAALLLAVYPPAALFAVDARAYALCALLVAIGCVAVHEQRVSIAAIAFVAAAYTHWYGALFLPLVLLARPRRKAAIAFAASVVAFGPGLWLAARQPSEAMGWLVPTQPFAALESLAFVGRYAEALFAPAPLALVLASAVLVLAAGARSRSFLPMVLVPLLLAIAFALAGRTVYVPMRFESVLAVPLVLWLATSLERWPRNARVALTAALALCGAFVLARGAADHAQRPLDDYRAAATVLAQRASPHERVVATGYLYLEAVSQLGERRVEAWPREQARHPGWRARVAPEPFPRGPFLWIAERRAPELARADRSRVRVLYSNGRAFIARVQ